MKVYLYVASHEGMYLLNVVKNLHADFNYYSNSGWAMSAIYKLCKLGFLIKKEDRELDELEEQNKKKYTNNIPYSRNNIRVYINW